MNVQKLIEDNINLVYFVIHKHYPTFRQDEDIVQCGMVGLCQAANAWDEAKGTFANFAINCINNEIIREFTKRKRQPLNLSLEYEYRDNNGDSSTLADILVGVSDVDWVDMDGLYDVLTEKERIIVDMKRMGLTQREIAKRLGVSNESVSKHLRRAKLRLEKNK